MITIRKTDQFLNWLRGVRDIRAVARIQVRIDRLAFFGEGRIILSHRCLQAFQAE